MGYTDGSVDLTPARRIGLCSSRQEWTPSYNTVNTELDIWHLIVEN